MERGSRWRTFPRPLFDSSPEGHLPSPDLSSSRPLRRQHLVPALTTDPGPVDQPPRRRRLVLPRGGGGSSFLGGLAEPAEPRPRGDGRIRTPDQRQVRPLYPLSYIPLRAPSPSGMGELVVGGPLARVPKVAPEGGRGFGSWLPRLILSDALIPLGLRH